MAPFQTTVSMRQDSAENIGQDVINVQILSDEDIWAENTTAITGNTSERSESLEGVDEWSNDEGSFNVTCSRYIGPLFTCTVIACAFFSPLIMVILPKIGFFPDTLSLLTTQQKLLFTSCNIECKGHIIGLAFKVTLLGIGSWAIFFKPREALMPRLFMFRTGVTILTMLCVCSYWLFYIVQITEGAKSAIIGHSAEYKNLVTYAGNLIDTLLFIHYIAVLLLEIRHLRPAYYLKIFDNNCCNLLTRGYYPTAFDYRFEKKPLLTELAECFLKEYSKTLKHVYIRSDFKKPIYIYNFFYPFGSNFLQYYSL